MFGNLSKSDRRLMIEVQECARQSRDMWKQMRATGHGWTWSHYRGWLLDAREIRQGKKFRALGREGVPSRYMPKPQCKAA